MRKFILLLLVVVTTTTFCAAQANTDKYLDQVKTLDSTLKTLYGVISGEKGEERDWELFRYLFKPDAKMIPTWKNPANVTSAKYMTPEDYIERSGPWLVENGFIEKEIYRTSNTFGPISQVFSTYECYNSVNDEKPFMRGINSIQLLYDNNRWWVVNIYWTQESEDNPIPVNYLPK